MGTVKSILMMIVSRRFCTDVILTHLSLSETSVTDESVDCMIETLSETLVLLICNDFSIEKMKQLSSIPNLLLQPIDYRPECEGLDMMKKDMPEKIGFWDRHKDLEEDFDPKANAKTY